MRLGAARPAADSPSFPAAHHAAPEGMLSFGDLAWRGANALWRYGLSVTGVVGLGTLIAFTLAKALAFLDWGAPLRISADPDAYAEASLSAQLGAFAFVMGTVIAFLPPARLLLPFLHKRAFRSFLTARARFSWLRVLTSFSVLLVLLAVSLALELALLPGALRLSFEPRAFIAFAALSAVVIPVQAFTEELLFRGFLVQAVGRLTRQFALRAGLPALVFVLAHLANPELSYGALWAAATYALSGLYLSILALKGEGLELPLGAHLAVNFFVSLVARPEISAIQSPALFIMPEPELTFSLLSAAVLFFVHYFVMTRLGLLGR